MKDYYKILEIEKTAPLNEIKKSFKRLSKIHHPDKGGVTEKFQEINEAYQILSNTDKRKAYDTGTTYIQPREPVINDLGIVIPWTLADIKNGKTVQLQYQRVVVCKTCNGVGSLLPESIIKCTHCNGFGRISKQERTPFGYIMMEQTCYHCQGRGSINSAPCKTCNGEEVVNELVKESIIIPPGIAESYILYGKGHNTPHGDSNLIIYFEFPNSNELSLFKGILHKSILVDFFDALLGKEITILLGDKTLKMTLAKESVTGNGFRLNAAYYGIDVIVNITVSSLTIKQAQEYILNLFKEDIKVLPIITKRINESFK